MTIFMWQHKWLSEPSYNKDIDSTPLSFILKYNVYYRESSYVFQLLYKCSYRNIPTNKIVSVFSLICFQTLKKKNLRALQWIAILKASDLSEEIQTKIFELSQQALAAYKIEKDIATYLKKELDQIYGPTWHVIVGKSFGSYVTHEQGFFIYFYIDELAFLIFKSG